MIHIVYKNPSADRHVSHVGLGVTASHLTNSLIRAGLDAAVHGVKNGEELEQIVRKENPTHVVMCASFIDTPWVTRFVDRHPRTLFINCLHSNPAFLSVDNFATKTMREQITLQSNVENFKIAGNSTRYVNAVRAAFNTPCLYLPNLYPIKYKVEPSRYVSGPLKIGMFGATRQLKNLMVGAWAAIVIKEKLKVPTELYINSGRTEHGDGIRTSLESLTANIPNFTLKEVPWMNWREHCRFVSTMHLHLQPSFTESFNNTVADCIEGGVQSVVGYAIDWVPNTWKANPDDVIDVAETGISLLRHPYGVLKGHKSLKRYHKSGVLEWKRALGYEITPFERLENLYLKLQW